MNGVTLNGVQNNAQIGLQANAKASAAQNAASNEPDVSFQSVLAGARLSKHAYARLNAREVNLSDEQLSRVESGIEKARQKGIRDSLVLVDNVALLVSVKNRVVVTAVNRGNENVFTNIDGAVIV